MCKSVQRLTFQISVRAQGSYTKLNLQTTKNTAGARNLK